MPEAISKETAKLLKDVTGEPRLDAAVRLTVRDALEHRLREVQEGIAAFEERYGMSFAAFEEAWEAGDVEERHSFDVEKDYWDWEALVTRRRTIEDALERF